MTQTVVREGFILADSAYYPLQIYLTGDILVFDYRTDTG
jgi:hypothetical protein